MTQTTRRLRESSVLIVDCAIPEGMTIGEYRRARHASIQHANRAGSRPALGRVPARFARWCRGR